MAKVGSDMSVAVVYARVSTGEQAKRNVANLPTQQKKCRDWCNHDGHSGSSIRLSIVSDVATLRDGGSLLWPMNAKDYLRFGVSCRAY